MKPHGVGFVGLGRAQEKGRKEQGWNKAQGAGEEEKGQQHFPEGKVTCFS